MKQITIEVDDITAARLERLRKNIEQACGTPTTLQEILEPIVAYGLTASEGQRGLLVFDDRPLSAITLRELAAATGCYDLQHSKAQALQVRENTAAAMAQTLKVFEDSKTLKAVAAPIRLRTREAFTEFFNLLEQQLEECPATGYLTIAWAIVDEAGQPITPPPPESKVN